MHLEAEQYNYALESLAAEIPRWQADNDKLADYIETERGKGKNVLHFEIRLNHSIKRLALIQHYAEATAALLNAQDEESKVSPGLNDEKNGAAATPRVIRDMPTSLQSEVLYTQELILGMHEWVTGIDEKLNQLQQTITPLTNGKKRGD